MRRFGRLAFRSVILAYAALLVIGAWPYPDAPGIGRASTWAERMLAKIAVRPGLVVFTARDMEPNDWKLRVICHRIEGIRQDGGSVLVYAPECPPRGFAFGTNYFDVMLQRLTRATSERSLREPQAGAVDPGLIGVRRFSALGDWFCSSPESGGTRFARVHMRQQRQFQSYATGRLRAGPILTCRWDCGQEPAPLPHCMHFPPISGAALVEGSGS